MTDSNIGMLILTTILTLLGGFIAGALSILLLGSRASLHYLIVKASRGTKILLFGKTRFGWRTFVAGKSEEFLKWKFDKKKKYSVVSDNDLARFGRVDCGFVDTDFPLKLMPIPKGSLYPESFDYESFSNILERAMTRPTTDGFAEMKKLIQFTLIAIVIVGIGLILLYMKVSKLSGGAVTGGVI